MKNNISLRKIFFVLILGNLTLSTIIAAESIATIEPNHLIINDHNANSSLQLQSIAQLTNISIDGIKVSELSGIVWDDDENLLYAVSDNGYLLHFRPVFTAENLSDILFVAGYPLFDGDDKQLKWKMADSEGITAINNHNGKKKDTEVLISFERFPRIIRFSTSGKQLAEIELPGILKNRNDYKSENKMLESLAFHQEFGLLTGIEMPLKTRTEHGLYVVSMKNAIWRFNAYDDRDGGLVGMTTTPEGHLLLVERTYHPFWQRIDTTIHEVTLMPDKGNDSLVARYKLPNDTFDENFEGITHYKNNYFFMISDDNNHPFKHTVLVFFKLDRN